MRRDVRLIRRFEHGVGGTSIIEIDGARCVLKAWPFRSAHDEARLGEALNLAEIMRGRGVAVPGLWERGCIAGYGYLIYELLDGDWSAALGLEALVDMIGIVDASRDAAPAPNVGWVAELEMMLSRGDRSFDIAPDVLTGSPAAEAVLAEARRRLAACDRASLRIADIVHGDFAPENLLIRDGRVVGVVDWERARAGDAGLDLVGAIFDIEIAKKARASLRQQLWSLTRDRIPADALAAYVGIYAVRYLSWALGTDMEVQVLELAHRMLRRTDELQSSP